MTRRPGLSLTEVLVALFIMGIGTIAILTLFPLGALNMAQALRDDRTTQAAGQADAYLRWYVQNATDNGTLAAETFFSPLNDPGSTTVSRLLIPVDQATLTTLKVSPNVPSYPVVIDPMGFLARPSVGGVGRPQVWVGDNGFGDTAAVANTSALTRATLNLVGTNSAFALRTCTLLDGFGYDQSGRPDASSGVVDRDVRYNWLWVVQRPDNTAAQATVTVVVFDRRASGFAPPGSETAFTPLVAQPGSTRISFALGQVPIVQKGGWLMDATVVVADATGTSFAVPSGTDGTAAAPAGTQPWIRNANFYRVVSVTDNGAGADIELEVPLKIDAIPSSAPATATVPLPPQFRRFIFLNGAAEVFVRQVPLNL